MAPASRDAGVPSGHHRPESQAHCLLRERLQQLLWSDVRQSIPLCPAPALAAASFATFTFGLSIYPVIALATRNGLTSLRNRLVLRWR